jgi:hypothetical protein
MPSSHCEDLPAEFVNESIEYLPKNKLDAKKKIRIKALINVKKPKARLRLRRKYKTKVTAAATTAVRENERKTATVGENIDAKRRSLELKILQA